MGLLNIGQREDRLAARLVGSVAQQETPGWRRHPSAGTISARAAFILTGADFPNVGNPSPPEGLILQFGPTASPCTFDAAFSVSEVEEATANQVFQPGIAIPAGDAIGLRSQGDAAGVVMYGYLVPASEVPQHAATAGSGRTSFLPLPRR